MFSWCGLLPDINTSLFDTSNATNLGSMFSMCKTFTKLDCSHFDTSKVTNMACMFNWCSGLTELDITGFDTSKVTSFAGMFMGIRKAEIDVSHFDTSSATDMSHMFSQTSMLKTEGLLNFDTRNVKDMSEMFYYTSYTVLDLSSFDMHNVTSIYGMFKWFWGKTIYVDGDKWDTPYLRSGGVNGIPNDECFVDAFFVVGGAGTEWSEEHTSSDYARIDGKDGLPGYLTAKVSVNPDTSSDPVDSVTPDDPGDTSGTDTGSGNMSDSANNMDSGTANGEAYNADVDKEEAESSSNESSDESMRSYDAVTRAIEGIEDDSDAEGSKYSLLRLRGIQKGKKKIKLKWNSIEGAAYYVIYGNKCGVKNRYKYITRVSGGKTSKTFSKLRKGTFYKYIVSAFDANGNEITTSKTVHVITKGGKKTNCKKLKLRNTKRKKTLSVGGTYKIKTKQVKQNKKLKLVNHRKIAYESTNNAVATVNKQGRVTAVGTGTCYIYAYAQNGKAVRVEIVVK